MAYLLTHFGAIDLPLLNGVHNLDTVAAKNTIIRTILNGFDSAGSGQADQDLPKTLSYRGTLIAEPLSNLADWRDTVDALRAMSRKRATLIRQALDNDEQHYCTARFIASKAQASYQQPFQVYDTTIQFLQFTPWVGHDHRTWHLDDGHSLDTALYLDDSGVTVTLTSTPQSVVINNGGNRSTNNIRLTFTVGLSPLTSVTVTCGGAEFTFSGTVAASGTLVIDSGAQSVINSGANAYASFALTSNHTIEDWLRFDPGNNTVTVTRSGGTGTTLLVEYQDGWE